MRQAKTFCLVIIIIELLLDRRFALRTQSTHDDNVIIFVTCLLHPIEKARQVTVFMLLQLVYHYKKNANYRFFDRMTDKSR